MNKKIYISIPIYWHCFMLTEFQYIYKLLLKAYKMLSKILLNSLNLFLENNFSWKNRFSSLLEGDIHLKLKIDYRDMIFPSTLRDINFVVIYLIFLCMLKTLKTVMCLAWQLNSHIIQNIFITSDSVLLIT